MESQIKRGACGVPFDERRRRKTEKGQNRLLAADSSFEGRSSCSWAPEKKDFTELDSERSKKVDLRRSQAERERRAGHALPRLLHLLYHLLHSGDF